MDEGRGVNHSKTSCTTLYTNWIFDHPILTRGNRGDSYILRGAEDSWIGNPC